jgi:hypothetical protein
MNTTTLPRAIALRRGGFAAFADRLVDGLRALRSAWTEHQARRLAEDVERELMQLDPRTLHDIGASEGLVGQRRWQEEQADARAGRLLDLRGW